MATVRLTDVIVPEVYAQYMAVDSPEVTRFFESGIVTQNEMLSNLAAGGGNVLNVPFWKDLDSENEPNISSDDPGVTSTPDKIEAGRQIAMLAYLNQSWSSMDLVSELAGSDPMDRIQARTNNYWSRQWQRRLIASTLGIMRDNEANDDGDMVHDITVGDTNSPDDTNLFGGSASVKAEITLGDQIGLVNAVGVHSAVYGRMLEQELIEFIQPADGPAQIPTYRGKRVILDDGLPVITNGANLEYTSVFFGAGAFGFGTGSPRTPVEVDRDPDQGNGSGAETLYERRTWLLHPFGFAIDPQAASGQSFTKAELEDAATWDRVVERKSVPMAFLKTNG